MNYESSCARSSHRPATLARLARIAFAWTPAVLCFVLASCAPEGRVLARVGNRVITESELLAAARGGERQYPWSPDSAKHVLLDDLIRRDLMLVEAERRGLTRDSTLVLTRREAEEEI